MCMLAPYDIPNQLIDGYDVVVNKPKTAAYRAPGAPAASFAAEAVINEVANRLDSDPMDFRLKNAAKEGTTQLTGRRFPRIGNVEVMEAVKSHPHYSAEIQSENQGRGVAMGFWFNAGMETSSTGSVNSDGTVSLALGSVDIGGTRPSTRPRLTRDIGIAAGQVEAPGGRTG